MAFLIFLPNLIWEVRYHFPFLELMRNVRASGRDVVLGPLGFLGQQAMIMHPLSFVLVVPAGLWFLFFDREGRRFRILGWEYVALLVTFMLLHGKNYYVLRLMRWCSRRALFGLSESPNHTRAGAGQR